MPYIAKDKRQEFVKFVESMKDVNMTCAGDLNYLVTMLTHRYLNQEPESYARYNDVVGVLEGAKLELYRRHVAEYEDEKVKENGDV